MNLYNVNRFSSITSFQWKAFACACMFIDHLGAVLFPDFIMMRVIGRFAFPIFAFLIAFGYEKTSNWKLYAGRLLSFAIISQWPFWYAFDMPGYYNVFFTLTAALVGIHMSDRWNSPLPPVVLGILCEWLHTDWGIYGVILPYLLYAYRNDQKRMVLSTVLFTLLFDTLAFISSGSLHAYIQAVWIILLIPLTGYRGEKGYSSVTTHYAFYLFYPLHLILLGWLDQIGIFM